MNESMTEKLKKSFVDSKMSIRQLSIRAGTPYSSTHGLIKDGKNPQIFTFEKLAGALNLELKKIDKGSEED